MTNVFNFPTQGLDDYWTTLWCEMFMIESDSVLFIKNSKLLNFYHDLDRFDHMNTRINRTCRG